MFPGFFSAKHRSSGGDLIPSSGKRDEKSGLAEESLIRGKGIEQAHPSTENEVANLQGKLLMRMGRASGHASFRWRVRYVHLAFANGGSLAVYEDTPETIKHAHLQEQRKLTPAELKRNLTKSVSTTNFGANAIALDPLAASDSSEMLLYVPSHLPWRVLDVEGSMATFAIEIPTEDEDDVDGGLHLGETVLLNKFSMNTDSSTAISSEELPNQDEPIHPEAEDTLYDEMTFARKRRKPLRIYFKCRKGAHEKGLWLDGFSKIDRLSIQTRHQKGLLSTLANGVRKVTNNRVRTRTMSGIRFATDARRLDLEMDDDDYSQSGFSNTSARLDQFMAGKPLKNNSEREFKVDPGYAYPHRWMTIPELYEEMILPSAHFHDLRDPNKADNEIGTLKVEVLQCVGLPRLDRASDTDAVVYLVMGPCAFTTDVIPDRTNPMWLRKAQRACIFPIYHGYARLYVAVFDDDGGWSAVDDLAGRVVIDVARLRAACTYDVTLPLRMSAHLYQKKKRGAVRLRFTLNWIAEKDVLRSYIPQRIKLMPPQKSKPDVSTTIACADIKSFRNVATTVHGYHLPGKFSFSKVRACIREINFTRKYVMGGIMEEIKAIRIWANPTISAFVFCAWMHCIYENKFSLVPGYVVLFFVLQLVRTYAIFVVERSRQEGFVGPTFEEMMKVLLLPRCTMRKSIQALQLRRSDEFESLQSIKSSPNEFDCGRYMKSHCHEPKGRALFKLLGFIPWNDDAANKRNLHMEFPMANGNAYPKFTVRECIVREGDENEEENEMMDAGLDSMSEIGWNEDGGDSGERNSLRLKGLTAPKLSRGKYRLMEESMHDDSTHYDDNDGLLNEDIYEVGTEGENGNSLHRDVPDEGSDKQANQHLHEDVEIHSDSHDAMHLIDPYYLLEKLNPLHLKDQDMDWTSPNAESSKITDDIERISFKLHQLLWSNFNDRCYTIKKPKTAFYFGESKKSERRRTKHLDRKLDKTLGLKSYSNSNPVISRLGLFVEPIVMAILGYLCAFRAGFNIITWQDPYLTFLLFVFSIILCIVLFLLPWRICLFAVGIVLLGPQNWAIRVLRQRGILPPVKARETKEELNDDEQQNLFHCHRRLDGLLGPKPPPEIDQREVQYVVVPYGPFMYQRFYDWPPEQQHATVTLPNNELENPGLTNSLRSSSSRRMSNPLPWGTGTRYQRIHKLRNRIKRGTGTGTSKTEVEHFSQLSQLKESLSEFETSDRGKIGKPK